MSVTQTLTSIASFFTNSSLGQIAKKGGSAILNGGRYLIEHLQHTDSSVQKIALGASLTCLGLIGISKSRMGHAVAQHGAKDESKKSKCSRYSLALLGAGSVATGVGLVALGSWELYLRATGIEADRDKWGRECREIAENPEDGLSPATEFPKRVSCPTRRLCCDEQDLQSRLNYLCRPGRHSVYSPIVGSRAHELIGIKQFLALNSVAKAFDLSLEQEEIFSFFPKACKRIADKMGNEMFSRYLDRYRHCGVTEENAIDWSYANFRLGVTYIYDIENKANTWNVHAVIEKDGIVEDRYLPPGITALHEIMHVEEISLRSKSVKTQPGNRQPGLEVLPFLTTLMQLDQVFKTCKNLPLSSVAHYGKTLTVNRLSLPLGEVANCYRDLTEKFGSIYEAFTSEQSLTYLETGVCK